MLLRKPPQPAWPHAHNVSVSARLERQNSNLSINAAVPQATATSDPESVLWSRLPIDPACCVQRQCAAASWLLSPGVLVSLWPSGLWREGAAYLAATLQSPAVRLPHAMKNKSMISRTRLLIGRWRDAERSGAADRRRAKAQRPSASGIQVLFFTTLLNYLFFEKKTCVYNLFLYFELYLYWIWTIYIVI
jgi:hypothetical protein